MAQINISIPDAPKGWAEQRYSGTSDYVRDLVRRDQEYQQKAEARTVAGCDRRGASFGCERRDDRDYHRPRPRASWSRLKLSLRAAAVRDHAGNFINAAPL
jgi:antitoxin ParD1/3/4